MNIEHSSNAVMSFNLDIDVLSMESDPSKPTTRRNLLTTSLADLVLIFLSVSSHVKNS